MGASIISVVAAGFVFATGGPLQMPSGAEIESGPLLVVVGANAIAAAGWVLAVVDGCWCIVVRLRYGPTFWNRPIVRVAQQWTHDAWPKPAMYRELTATEISLRRAALGFGAYAVSSVVFCGLLWFGVALWHSLSGLDEGVAATLKRDATHQGVMWARYEQVLGCLSRRDPSTFSEAQNRWFKEQAAIEREFAKWDRENLPSEVLKRQDAEPNGYFELGYDCSLRSAYYKDDGRCGKFPQRAHYVVHGLDVRLACYRFANWGVYFWVPPGVPVPDTDPITSEGSVWALRDNNASVASAARTFLVALSGGAVLCSTMTTAAATGLLGASSRSECPERADAMRRGWTQKQRLAVATYGVKANLRANADDDTGIVRVTAPGRTTAGAEVVLSRVEGYGWMVTDYRAAG
jgi:hypothetical protein